MQLIYNCGRLRAKGYATFLGASGKAGVGGRGTDELWRAVEKGAPQPGSTGIVRKLAAEGREIVEILVLDHGRALTSAQTAALQAALAKVFDRDLAAALQAANAPTVSHATAQAMIEAALAAALPALARLVPPTAPKVAATPSETRQQSPRKTTILATGAIGTLLVLLGVGWLVLSPPADRDTLLTQDQDAPIAPSEETKAAVQDFLRACHGEPDPALTADLATAFAELAPVAHVGGRRAPLQLLDPADSDALPDLSTSTDAEICAKRHALWQMLGALRPHMGGTGALPYQDALAELSIPTAELALPRLAQTAAQAAPPPAAPADCARGKCFPILHPADLEALEWINGLYGALAAELPATAGDTAPKAGLATGLQDHAVELRAAEVRFRGELALVGITTDHPDWLTQLWDCAGHDHLQTCSFPLAETSAWARR